MELLIALAVGSIGLTIAIPSLRGFYLDQLQTTSINELTGSLRYARSEAVTRRTSVTLCVSGSARADRRAEDATTTEQCSAQGGWESGWLVFVDDNGNGRFEDGETMLRRHEALPPQVSMKGNTRLASVIVFGSQGMTSHNGTILYCDPRRRGREMRSIVLAVTGRVRTEAASTRQSSAGGNCL